MRAGQKFVDKPVSRLMREGAAATGECVGQYARRTDTGRLHTCAIGAIAVAKVGNFDLEAVRTESAHVEDMLGALDALHPVHQTMRSMTGIITGLNDFWGWPREKIADWLESIGL